MAMTSTDISCDGNFERLDRIIKIATATGLRSGSSGMMQDLATNFRTIDRYHMQFVNAITLAGISQENPTNMVQLGRLQAGSILKTAAPGGVLHAVANNDRIVATAHSDAKQQALDQIRQIADAEAKQLFACIRAEVARPYYDPIGPGVSAHSWIERRCTRHFDAMLEGLTRFVRLDAGGDIPA